MRRLIVLAATASAQLTEFSSHIILTGFDVENFNRPNRLAHIELFGVLGRVFFDGEWDPQNVRYFDRDFSRYAEVWDHHGKPVGGRIPYKLTSPEPYETLRERMRTALESGELQRIIDQHATSFIIKNAPVNVEATLKEHTHHETEPAPGPAPAPRPRAKDDDDDDALSGLDIFLIVFFVILFAVFNVMAFLVYQKRKREREQDQRDGIALVPPPTYLHPSLHHKTFPGAGPAASYRGRSGAFSDELQPTESFRNVSDPQYEFGTLGGDDMGKAFA